MYTSEMHLKMNDHLVWHGTPLWVKTSSMTQYLSGPKTHSLMGVWRDASMGPPTVQTNCCSSAQCSTCAACYIAKRHLTQPCTKYFPLIHHSLIVIKVLRLCKAHVYIYIYICVCVCVCVCKAKVMRASTGSVCVCVYCLWWPWPLSRP